MSRAHELETGRSRALQAFIFDLDGVIWRGRTPIEGAVESVGRLAGAGKQCFYCTNNAARTQADVASRLRAIGLKLEDSDVLTSAVATAQYLQEQFAEPFSAYVIGEEGILDALRRVGARVLSGPEVGQDRVDAVVVGLDRQFTYGKLHLAQRFVRQGARFVATNRDTTFPLEDGLAPGAGSLVAAVEAASGVVPNTIGKPEPLMLELCLKQFGLEADRTVMVGDRLDTDIACAHRAGLRGLLVGTGVSSLEQGRAAHGLEKPDALFADLPALCRAVLED